MKAQVFLNLQGQAERDLKIVKVHIVATGYIIS